MEVNTPQVSETKETKKANWLLIILLILFFSLLSIAGTYYFLTVYEEKEVALDEEVVIEKEEDVLTQVEEDIEIINAYTNDNYPNMEIKYLSSWEVQVEEEVFDGREEEGVDGILMRVSEEYKSTLVTFSKKGYVLKIYLAGFPYITSIYGGNCYLEGELDYVRIKDGLTRNNEGDKYVYAGLLHDENYSPYLSWEESKKSPVGGCEDDGDYVAKGFPDILGFTNTSFFFTKEYGGTNTNMSANVSATLEISGEEDDEILKEADNIVLSLYNSISEE